MAIQTPAFEFSEDVSLVWPMVTMTNFFDQNVKRLLSQEGVIELTKRLFLTSVFNSIYFVQNAFKLIE